MNSSAGLWRRMQAQLAAMIAAMTERRRVVGIDGDGRLRVQSLDPDQYFEERIACIRGMVVDIGDDVMCLRSGGRLFAVGAIGTPGGGLPGTGGGSSGGSSGSTDARVVVSTSPPLVRTRGMMWFNPDG